MFRYAGVIATLVLATLVLGCVCAPVASAQSIEDLRQMSIDQLADVNVSSVTKSNEPLRDAPAAIYVITHDDIIRSGATTIPDMLRLAPNLFVAQTSASSFTVSARGFSGSASAQNPDNKLLVLIDGRTVYSPLHSGVFWDMQDVLPEDIDRIEVISGPGATLWGADAFNGVINIITKKASETQGVSVDVGGGNLQQVASFQYGGRLGDDLAWRVYAKTFNDEDTLTTTGAKARDSWTNPQGGFRADWTAGAADQLTLQGDVFSGDTADSGPTNTTIAGGNLLGRWNHAWSDGSTLQVQAYFDRASQSTNMDGGGFWVDTYDLDVQHSFALGARNQIVWGGGVRSDVYNIQSGSGLSFQPAGGDMVLGDLFAQDSFSITDQLKLIAGLKLEDDPYSSLAPMPDLRLSWKPNDKTLLWAAVSQAIRAPTPFDRDVHEELGGINLLNAGGTFQSEKLLAYEIGARMQPTDRLSFSVSTYYNVYNDLRSIEITPATVFPLHWGNAMRGYAYGVEAWGDYRLTDWWRLSAGFSAEHEQLSFQPGDPALLGVAEAGDDPVAQGQVRSSMNLGRDVTFDATLRGVSALPNPAVPAYTELNARLGWNVTPRIQLSVSGFNLLHAYHVEYPSSEGGAVPREVFVELRVRM
jgi:iron complex outermembrane receptor protein